MELGGPAGGSGGNLGESITGTEERKQWERPLLGIYTALEATTSEHRTTLMDLEVSMFFLNITCRQIGLPSHNLFERHKTR